MQSMELGTRQVLIWTSKTPDLIYSMKTLIHASAGTFAMLFLLVFLAAMLFSELKYQPADMISVQQVIFQTIGFYFFLLLMSGGIGLLLGKERKGRIVEMKKKRMLAIIACSIFILLPCNYVLSNYDLDSGGMPFMRTLEGIEVIAIVILITLLGFNFKDGTRLTAVPPSAS